MPNVVKKGDGVSKKDQAIANAIGGGSIVGALLSSQKINPSKYPSASRKYKAGGKVSRVNEAGNYTKPGMRKRLFERVKSGSKGGDPGEWSARKAQLLAKLYKKAGGGYRN